MESIGDICKRLLTVFAEVSLEIYISAPFDNLIRTTIRAS